MPLSIAYRAWLFLVLLSTLGHARLDGQLPPPGDPPYVPTPMTLVNQMLDMAGVGEGDIVYDLGSGDGRIVIAAAQRGARGVGIEYEEWLVARSVANADSAGVRDAVHFVQQDVFEADVRDATVVMLYLGAEFNTRLRPRLLGQLRPGTRVVSHAFHMDDWKPDRTQTVGSGASRATIFYWVVPVEVEGFWSLRIGDMQPVALELEQTFQEISGMANGGDGAFEVSEGSIRGEVVHLELQPLDEGTPLVLRGRLENGRLTGTVEGADGGARWSAVRFTDPSQAPR